MAVGTFRDVYTLGSVSIRPTGLIQIKLTYRVPLR